MVSNSKLYKYVPVAICSLLHKTCFKPSINVVGAATKISTGSANLPHNQTVLRCPPPIPPLPPISPTVAVEQFSPGSISLEEEIERLDEEYTEIESLVLEMIREHKIPHKTMLKWIQVLPMTLKSQFSELLQRNAKALSNASNVDELFLIVSPYWNSLHPTLLVHVPDQEACR
jgi:hypothetical protein